MNCEICDDQLFDDSTQQLECGHIFCKLCVENIIAAAVDQYTTTTLRCPTISCCRPFKEPFVLRFLEDQDLTSLKKRYLKIIQDRLIIDGKTMIMCPMKTCQCVFSFKAKSNRQTLECPNCHINFCSECRQLDHGGQLCQVDRNDNLKNLHDLKTVKSCPTCKVPIEKESGCNHVLCTFCGRSFCWLCGRKYTQFHYAVFNVIMGCPGMENLQQSLYFKQRAKVIFVMLLFLSIILGTWAVLQFFVSLVVLFVECIPGTIICGLTYCALKHSFTKANFVVLQLTIHPYRILVAKMLAVGFVLVIGLFAASTVWSYLKRKKIKGREKSAVKRPVRKSSISWCHGLEEVGKTEG